MWLNKVFIYTGASAIVVVVALVVIFGRQPITTALDNSLNAVTAFAGNINYIESRTQLGERIQPDFEGYMMRLREFTACAEDTTPSKATSSCSWLGKNTKAIYLTGDSHASHFRPMVDGMPDSYDLFYQYTARNTIVNWNWYGAPIDTQKTIDQKVAELQQLDRVYEDVYFLLSMYFRKDADQTDTLEQNLTALVEALDPYAQIVLIAPTPVWPNGPSVCVLLGRKCMLDTQTDMETVAPILAVFNKIATTHDRVFVYNAYNEICTSDECSIYERSTDHLWYLDEDHLSVEGSKKLAPNFSAWFQNTFQN